MPRLIDADRLLKGREDHEVISTHLIWNAPTVDAEPVRHGHWINHFDDLFPEDSSVECSVCHEYEGIMANDNYCPNCGAKMDESSQLL